MGCKLAAVSVKQRIASDWGLLVPDGTDVEFHEICESTNSLASVAGATGKATPKWFVAGEQSAGRGRRSRAWTSNPGNLFCSYLFRPCLKVSDLATLPFLVSLTVRDTFISLGCDEAAVQCKWPNDVLICEKKASGILIESSAAPGLKTDFIVIGIGLNLAHFPEDTQFAATSVCAQTGHSADTATAFKILSHTLDQRLQTWQPNATAKLLEEWRACAWGMGMRREINAGGESFHATLIGLEDDGGLRLRLDNGIEKQLYAGDVFTSPISG